MRIRPRTIELGIGVWLIASPWVFGYPDPSSPLFIKDVVCGALVILFSALSFWTAMRWAHYFTGLVAVWLGTETLQLLGRPDEAPAWNELAAAFLLLALFLFPTGARASGSRAGTGTRPGEEITSRRS